MIMAADVSSLVRMMNAADSETAKSTALTTRDLLGGCSVGDSQELDLDLQVPCGYEKRLDLKSGRVYIQRCNPSTSSSSTSDQNPRPGAKLQDLNVPPTKLTLTLFDDASLDLKLVSSSPTAASPSSCNYQSVCTLDKVKSALERAEKGIVTRKRSISMSKSPSLKSTSSSTLADLDPPDEKGSATLAVGCPTCLLYVLIMMSNPRCPRCNTVVPLPVDTKKPRIDLNISI